MQNDELNKGYFLDLVSKNNTKGNHEFHFECKPSSGKQSELEKHIITITHNENRVIPISDEEIEFLTFHHHNYKICNSLIATLNLIKSISDKPQYIVISQFYCIYYLNLAVKETPQYKFFDSEVLLSFLFQNISKTIENIFPNVYSVYYLLDKNEIHFQFINPTQQLYNQIRHHH